MVNNIPKFETKKDVVMSQFLIGKVERQEMVAKVITHTPEPPKPSQFLIGKVEPFP